MLGPGLWFGRYPSAIVLTATCRRERICCDGGARICCDSGVQNPDVVAHVRVSPCYYLNAKVIIVCCHELSFVISCDPLSHRMTKRYSVRVGKNETHAPSHRRHRTIFSGIPVTSCDFPCPGISSRDLHIPVDGQVRRAIISVVCGPNRGPHSQG